MNPTLEHVQTNSTELVNIGVVYSGQKPDLRRGHRIVVRQKKLCFEDASYRFSAKRAQSHTTQLTLIWRRRRPVYRDIEIPQVVVVRYCVDARNTVTCLSRGTLGRLWGKPYGSDIRRSVSLIIRFGKAMATQDTAIALQAVVVDSSRLGPAPQDDCSLSISSCMAPDISMTAGP